MWSSCVFFVKQKTAYNMRISDWSPDVCSSDLVIIALTYIHGSGRKTAVDIADKRGIDHSRRIQDLSDAEILQIRETLDADHTVEGDLRRNTAMNIKRLMDLACYRGLRHRKGLPVRGQRTHTNARTRKGKARSEEHTSELQSLMRISY